MSYRMLLVKSGPENKKVLETISKNELFITQWINETPDGHLECLFFLKQEDTQEVLDTLETILGYKNLKIIIFKIEAIAPIEEEYIKEKERIREKKEKKESHKATEKTEPSELEAKLEGGEIVDKKWIEKNKEKLSHGFKKLKSFETKIKKLNRAELHAIAQEGTIWDMNYFMFVVFSTIIAAIGLLRDNIPVIIAAMVIAPFLSNVFAFSFGAAMADNRLMKRALRVAARGFLVCIILSIILGYSSYPEILRTPEIMARTVIDYNSVLLALTSGAVAALAITAGSGSSTLIGAIAAIAILLPLVVFGMMIGSGQFDLALGAFLLFGINLICINFSTQVVFLFKQIRPRVTTERSAAKTFIVSNIIAAAALIVLVTMFIYFQDISYLIE